MRKCWATRAAKAGEWGERFKVGGARDWEEVRRGAEVECVGLGLGGIEPRCYWELWSVKRGGRESIYYVEGLSPENIERAHYKEPRSRGK